MNTTALSAAGSIALDGDINLLAAGDVVLNTDGSGTDALININGSVNNATSKNLTLDAGRADVLMTGTAGAGTALQSLTVTGNNVALGQVTSVDAIDVTANTNGNGVIDLSGDLTTSSASGTIDLLQADISLLSDVQLTTINNAVTIDRDVNSHSSTPFRSLTVSVGNNDITIGGDVGNTNALQKIELLTTGTGTQIDVGSITTTDTTATTSADNTATSIDTGVLLTAETINLGGDITSNTLNGLGTEAGVVDINGAATLSSNVSINTNLAGSTTNDGNVDFSSTIESASHRFLELDAGNADVTINGNIGGNGNELSRFTVTNAGTTNVFDVNTRTGGIDVTSGTINLSGGLNTTALSAAGSIALDGNINLLAAGDVVLNTDGSGSDAFININGSVNNTTSKNLTLDAGTADVSMTGTAGTGTALQSLTVTGNNVALGQVTSVDAIDVTANTNGNGVIDLSGNLTTTGTGTSSSINLKQADVTLSNNVTLQVANTTANNITVEGMIDSDLNTNNRSLTIIAGSGVVDLQGDIGSVNAIQGLAVAVAAASTTNLQAVTTRSGGINVTTSSLNLAGDLVTNDNSIAGDISLTAEKVDLTNNVTLDTVSTSTDGNIDILTTGAALGLDGGTNAFTVNAGLGDVMISHNISNVSGFDLQSSGTTILNGISSLGMITTNANNGLTLNGSYSAMTLSNEVMSFNADSNGDGAGILRFGAGSSFINTSGPITFTGATFNSGNNFIVRTGVNGTDTVRFNATNHMSLGDNTVGFRLNNVQLSNITASDIRLNAVNDIYYSNVSQLNGPAYVLNAGNDIRNTGFITSTFSSLNATAVNTIDVGGSITTNQDLLLTGTTINISGSQTLRSNNGNVILNGVITGATGDLSLYADNAVNDGLVQFVTAASNTNLNSLYVSADSIDLGAGNITTNNDLDINIRASTGAYSINSNMESLFGSVNINAGSNAIVMASGTMIKARNNVDLINSSGGIGLSLVESTLGQINITAGNAPIYDNNNGAPNITSSGSVILTATGGIGSGDALELRMNGPDAELSAFNSGSGSIEVSNTGDVTLLDITNTASNSPFKFEGNGGDVTIGSITLDTDIANTNAEVSFNMLAGSVYGVKDEPLHVTANSATFNLNGNGEIGDEIGNSPLIVDIRYKLTDINTTNTYIQYYLNRKPQIYEGANQFKNKALQAIENISGQQLIEVEALGNVDEAIFSDVRNYNHSDIALMMPSDQRYTEDEEEDEDAKLKRQKLINSTP